MLRTHSHINRLLSVLLLLCITQISLAQTSKGKCKVEPIDVSEFTAFGSMVYYSVDFKNYADKTVDAVHYMVRFFDKKGREIEKRSDSYQSSGPLKPIAQGFTKTVRKTVNIKDAEQVIVEVEKVVFFDGSVCE